MDKQKTNYEKAIPLNVSMFTLRVYFLCFTYPPTAQKVQVIMSLSNYPQIPFRHQLLCSV